MRPLVRLALLFASLLALAVGCGDRTGLLVPIPDASLPVPDAPSPPPHVTPPPEASLPDAFTCDPTSCTSGCTTSSGPGPVQRICVVYPAGADSQDECDGHHDAPGFAPNGATGNGFDDNCNGLVDEGCDCAAPGTTKPCYLVPASQTLNDLPVGWCAQNSKGTVNCAQQAGMTPKWSAQCRGAQAPNAVDICAPGDFNCDGKEENPPNVNCACQQAVIACPTGPVTTIPYPPVNALPLRIDASSWFSDPAAVALASGWTWTLTGGDCDNILPHPSFGIYAGPNASGSPVDSQNNALGPSGKERGAVASAPAVTSVVYPAFSLSGDYLLEAKWTLYGMPFTCDVKIQVRAPGLRAEACWDTEPVGDDLDLHMAKVNAFPLCANEEDWSDLSLDPTCANANEDCYYGDCLAGSSTTTWGFADSPASVCAGWGSQSQSVLIPSCANPRLDRDSNGTSGTCDPAVRNPNSVSGLGPFCGSENINLDHPGDGDVFAVGLRYYTQLGGTNARAHVNVYCDGARVLSTGYDPIAGNQFPQLAQSGGDSNGDMWKVGLVTTKLVAGALSCDVVPAPSRVPHLSRDGSTSYCVDNDQLDGVTSQSQLTRAGPAPTAASQLCFH